MNINQWKVIIGYTSKDEIGSMDTKIIQAETLHTLRHNTFMFLSQEKPTYIKCGLLEMKCINNNWCKLSNGAWYRIDHGRNVDELEAYTRFTQSMAFEKGHEYQDRAIVNGVFQLAAIHTVKRTHKDETVNALLKRGWYILSTPTEPDTDYILGHTEEDAI